MLIEIDGLFRMNLAQRLNDAGYQVFFAENPDDAKTILKKKNIDVIVLVLTFLKREGLNILRVINKMKRFAEVILINSSEQIHLSIEGMKLGAFDDFLVPFDIDSLVRRIGDAWQQKRNRETAKKSLRQRYQETMIAVVFAEAGETDTDLSFLGKGTESHPKTIRM